MISKGSAPAAELYSRGAQLLRELEQGRAPVFQSQSDSLKFLLDKFGLLTEGVAAEENLLFDDLLSGYVFRHHPDCSLGDVYVLRNKPLRDIQKVEELFKPK